SELLDQIRDGTWPIAPRTDRGGSARSPGDDRRPQARCRRSGEVGSLRQRSTDATVCTCFAAQFAGEVPGGAVPTTTAQTAQATMLECVELGIHRVWMLRGVGPAAFHRQPRSTAESRDRGDRRRLPMDVPPTSDFAHQCLGLVLSASGSVPRQVSYLPRGCAPGTVSPL